MSERKPLWRQRTSFSKDRNVSVVLWPPGQYKDHPTPPSISIEEGKRESGTWTNKRITLTLDKTPNIIENLRIAYGKALEIQGEQTENKAGVAQRETTKPTDQTKYLKTVLLEAMQPGKVYSNGDLVGMAKVDDWVTDTLAQKAINELLEQGKIRPNTKG